MRHGRSRQLSFKDFCLSTLIAECKLAALCKFPGALQTIKDRLPSQGGKARPSKSTVLAYVIEVQASMRPLELAG